MSQVTSKVEMSELRLAIVGSRSFHHTTFFERILQGWIKRHGIPNLIISGGAKGADALARDYANKSKIELKEFLPDWNRHGRSAGPIRNTQIVKLCTHILAFPSRKGRGTQDTIRKGTQAGKVVEVHYID